jgi:alpha-1,2-mannosyltransferase
VSDATTSGGVIGDLRSALDRLTRPPLVVAAAGLMLVLLLGVVGRHLAGLEAPSRGKIDIGTGDFMAFWTGAVTLHESNGAELYDYAAQQKLQARLLGGASEKFQPYLNPPLLALLLSTLVPLGYVAAFYVWDLACVVMLAAGIAATLAATPTLRARGGALAAVFLVAGYQPMVETTFGGQNSPITFGLLAALTYALHTRRPVAAALVLGLLTYKPQYALGVGGALLLAGQWRIVAGGVAVGVLHYLAGAWSSGARWPLEMMSFLQAYRPLEIANNADMHFSWVRTADWMLPSPLDSVLAAAGSVAVLVAWWRFRSLLHTRPGAWMALVVCGTMFASPHQQFYDAAILALPAALLVDHELRRRGDVPLPIRVLLLAAWVGFPVVRHAETIGFQPLFFVLVGVFAWSLRACAEESAGSAPA